MSDSYVLYFAQGLRGRVLDLSAHHMDLLTAEALRRPELWMLQAEQQLRESAQQRRQARPARPWDVPPVIAQRRRVLLGIDDETPHTRRNGETR